MTSPNQKWNYNGYGWTDLKTGDVLKATTDGDPIIAVGTQSHTDPHELWTFVTP
jgi:hypothetical protein